MDLARERIEGLAGAGDALADHHVEERVAEAQRLQGRRGRSLVAGQRSRLERRRLREAEEDVVRVIAQRRRQEGEGLREVRGGGELREGSGHPPFAVRMV